MTKILPAPTPAFLFALLFFSVLTNALAAAIPEDSWPNTISVHYQIHSPRPGLPAGFSSRMEHLHRHLSRELRGLNRWMETERIIVYLYPDRPSYIQGSFRPPPWSGGAAITAGLSQPKRLALIAGASDMVIAHELTHLFMDSFFAERGRRRAPRWLNEGLASMVENDVARRGTGALPKTILMDEFLRQSPQKDDAASRVGLWYRQAESLVRFLKQGPGFKFDSFCRALRDDVGLKRALFQVYAYPDIRSFERAWLAWAARQGKPAALKANEAP